MDDQRHAADPRRPGPRSLREGIDRLYPEMPAWQRSMLLLFMRVQHALAFAVVNRLLRRWSAGGSRQPPDHGTR
ncbi:MAG: hypothetical protein QOK40_171 [Miltoncostaeaceae bacterium]|jgi:hypothetical protein|nr:hypothetical protein [Miltoncostaeaceae bacterium]